MNKQAEKKTMKEYRLLRELPVKMGSRQGDVYFLSVPESVITGKEIKNRQLAPGSSKGSRHIVEGNVKIFDTWKAPKELFAKAAQVLRVDRERLVKALSGPAIKAEGAFRVTHPEHADYTLPAGCYVTWGQLDPRTMARVQD